MGWSAPTALPLRIPVTGAERVSVSGGGADEGPGGGYVLPSDTWMRGGGGADGGGQASKSESKKMCGAETGLGGQRKLDRPRNADGWERKMSNNNKMCEKRGTLRIAEWSRATLAWKLWDQIMGIRVLK